MRTYNNVELLKLKRVVYIIYSAPASSALCERIFSGAGLIFTKKRNRLGGENGGKLVVVRHFFRRLLTEWRKEYACMGDKAMETQIIDKLKKMLAEISLQ